MEEDSRPAPPRTRKPRAKSAPRPAGTKSPTPRARKAAAASTSPSERPGNGVQDPPPQFDHLVADDGFVRDFARIASENPKSAVLSALAVGVALGFFAALILSRD